MSPYTICVHDDCTELVEPGGFSYCRIHLNEQETELSSLRAQVAEANAAFERMRGALAPRGWNVDGGPAGIAATVDTLAEVYASEQRSCVDLRGTLTEIAKLCGRNSWSTQHEVARLVEAALQAERERAEIAEQGRSAVIAAREQNLAALRATRTALSEERRRREEAVESARVNSRNYRNAMDALGRWQVRVRALEAAAKEYRDWIDELGRGPVVGHTVRDRLDALLAEPAAGEEP